MQPQDLPVDLARLKDAWERFVDEGVLAEGLDPIVGLSWQRCAPRLNPHHSPQWAYLSASLQPLISIPHNFLKLVARPVMEDIYQFLEGTGNLLVLTDSASCIFEMVGDGDIETHARNLGFKPGAFLDEDRIGTNAFSLAIAESFPVQVAGPEHFLSELHGLYTAAAPLHDPTGRPIGALGLLRRQTDGRPQSLGVVFAAAKAIENQLQAEYFIREANAQATEFNATLDAVSEGILAWTAHGIVTHLNGRGGELLGIKPSQIVGRPLADRIALSEGVSGAVVRGQELNDVEARLRVDGVKHDVSLSLRIVRQQSGEPSAFITTLRPMAQVHGLVARLLGSQARLGLDDLTGRSAGAQEVRRQAEALVDRPDCILFTGEQGTGKNSLARAIHNSGRRAGGPFLAINGHAIPREHVIEEFLGFEPGALNQGAFAGQPSKFELAEGGTLFIEEIDALPLEMQGILVRILQTRGVVRLGGKRTLPVDARVMASTAQNLEERVRTGSFREDLFGLLAPATIHLPALRERVEDIPLLIERFLERLQGQFGTDLAISPRALDLLIPHSWPGNIAELESVLELAAFNAEGKTIEARHLADSLSGTRQIRPAGLPPATLQQMERHGIEEALLATAGNMSRAARMLGISRNTLYRKLKEFGIRPQPEGGPPPRRGRPRKH